MYVCVCVCVYGDNRGFTHEYTPSNRGQGPNPRTSSVGIKNVRDNSSDDTNIRDNSSERGREREV